MLEARNPTVPHGDHQEEEERAVMEIDGEEEMSMVVCGCIGLFGCRRDKWRGNMLMGLFY
jgi:hypothetical protein